MNALQKYLEQNGMNAYQLSLKVKVSPSTVTRHLDGKRGMSLAMAKTYAAAGVPWDVLLAMVPEETGQAGNGQKV